MITKEPTAEAIDAAIKEMEAFYDHYFETGRMDAAMTVKICIHILNKHIHFPQDDAA